MEFFPPRCCRAFNGRVEQCIKNIRGSRQANLRDTSLSLKEALQISNLLDEVLDLSDSSFVNPKLIGQLAQLLGRSVATASHINVNQKSLIQLLILGGQPVFLANGRLFSELFRSLTFLSDYNVTLQFFHTLNTFLKGGTGHSYGLRDVADALTTITHLLDKFPEESFRNDPIVEHLVNEILGIALRSLDTTQSDRLLMDASWIFKALHRDFYYESTDTYALVEEFGEAILDLTDAFWGGDSNSCCYSPGSVLDWMMILTAVIGNLKYSPRVRFGFFDWFLLFLPKHIPLLNSQDIGTSAHHLDKLNYFSDRIHGALVQRVSMGKFSFRSPEDASKILFYLGKFNFPTRPVLFKKCVTFLSRNEYKDCSDIDLTMIVRGLVRLYTSSEPYGPMSFWVQTKVEELVECLCQDQRPALFPLMIWGSSMCELNPSKAFVQFFEMNRDAKSDACHESPGHCVLLDNRDHIHLTCEKEEHHYDHDDCALCDLFDDAESLNDHICEEQGHCIHVKNTFIHFDCQPEQDCAICLARRRSI